MGFEKEERLGKKAMVMVGGKSGYGKKRSFRDRLKSGFQTLIMGSKGRKAKKAVETAKGRMVGRVRAEANRYIKGRGKGGEGYRRMLLDEGVNRAAKKMKKDKR